MYHTLTFVYILVVLFIDVCVFRVPDILVVLYLLEKDRADPMTLYSNRQ
jgi:hypothetical protein